MFFNSSKSHTKIETVVGAGTEIEGNIHTPESIRVDGKIKGEVHAESALIGEKGVVWGDVTANHVTVAGKVKGNISSASLIHILSKGQVFGDIKTGKLIISDGAVFEGNCQMIKTDGQIIELNPEVLGENSDSQGHQGKNLKVIPGNAKR